MSWAVKLLLWPLGKLAALGRALLSWMARDLRHVVICALAVLAVLLWLRLDRAGGERDKWQASSQRFERSALVWKQARDSLVDQVRKQRLAAAEADRRNHRRVEAELAAIKQETANAYQNRLADSRAALERLRRELAAAGSRADGGGGGAADLPGAYTARCRAFGAADCDQLLATLPDLLSEAEANTSKLIGLQDWVRAMLAIDFAGREGEPR